MTRSAEHLGWVLLSYRMPREPSAPRLALWRRLKWLGVGQISDGLVALPADARTQEQLEWAAQFAEEAGGTATVWLAQPTSGGQDAALIAAMSKARSREYSMITSAATDAMHEADVDRARCLRRLRGSLRDIRRRDFFPSVERDRAQAALDDLTRAVAGSPTSTAMAAPW